MLDHSQILKLNPDLASFRVMLIEEGVNGLSTAFDCFAEDQNHAIEQAASAYPGAIIKTVLPINTDTGPTTASDMANLYGHTSVDDVTTLKTQVNTDTSDSLEQMDLTLNGFGCNAYFEWVTEYGDPIADIFFVLTPVVTINKNLM